MRIDQSSMDLSTLVDKVERNEIDLQPDFQRGQVWSESKKRRLIDTVIRQWYVPAIHIVVNDDLDKEEVLDGQQRLRAIIDFMNDGFPIDGRIEPEDEEVLSLNGYYYSQLPDRMKSRFRRFPITTVRLRDYQPEEPGELFFRLNQLTALTAAEQRNALVGTPRNQIRGLVGEFEESVGSNAIGFSNARMNYDDTISRLAVTLEQHSLQEKVTAARLERRYRDGEGFSERIISSIQSSLQHLSKMVKLDASFVRLNKASLFSWLFFYIEYDFSKEEMSTAQYTDFFFSFEHMRSGLKGGKVLPNELLERTHEARARRALNNAIAIFNDRSSSRVNDVSSVLLRDLCLAASFCVLIPSGLEQSRKLRLRRSTIEAAISRLSTMPTEVAERAMEESLLSRQWEDRRAAS